jgi:hypothetical protein
MIWDVLVLSNGLKECDSKFGVFCQGSEKELEVFGNLFGRHELTGRRVRALSWLSFNTYREEAVRGFEEFRKKENRDHLIDLLGPRKET